jgi:hypothetical protein
MKRITEADATLITKELATNILNMNTRNRKVKKNNLVKLVHELETGLFKFNGESIIISKDGKLLDGQHRLLAVEQTGIPIKSIIVYDVEDNTFSTIDTGICRTTSDVLSVNNIENYALKAKLAKMFILGLQNKNFNGRAKSYKVTNEEVLRFAKDNDEELNDICSKAMRYYTKKRLLPTSDIGYFWHIFSSENRKIAEMFFEELFGGLFSSDKNPCYHLRNKLEDAKFSNTRKMDKPTRDKFIFKAWDKYLNNQEISFLRISEGEMIRTPKVVMGVLG